MLHHVQDLAIGFVEHYGYFGLFIMMVVGNIGAPIGSEIVLPVTGGLVATGHLSNVWIAIAVAVLIGVRFRIRERRASGVERSWRRTVVHDALAEGDRARHLPDEVADHLYDRRLHAVHSRLILHGLHSGVHYIG